MANAQREIANCSDKINKVMVVIQEGRKYMFVIYKIDLYTLHADVIQQSGLIYDDYTLCFLEGREEMTND